jgi:hypothetical protein
VTLVNLTSLVNPTQAAASFTPWLEGVYVVGLQVTDGCSTNTTTATVTVVRNCTAVGNSSTTAQLAYNYLSDASVSVCVSGGSTAYGGKFSLATSTAAQGNASLAGPFQNNAFPEYSSRWTQLQQQATRLQCETALAWRLVSYSEDFGVAVDPCSMGNGNNPRCGGSGLSLAASGAAVSAPTSAGANAEEEESTPVAKRDYFIAVMVVIAVVVAAVIGVLVYRQVKKPSGVAASSSAAAGFAFVPQRAAPAPAP